MPATQTIILTLTALTTALMAGLFFAYSCSVNPGLNRLSDAAYLAAMQSINRAIQNPIFFAGFFGAAILLPFSTYRHYEPSPSGRFWLLLAATIIYLVGVLGVTVVGNVPLNEALDAVDLQSATAQEMAARRARFEQPWNRLNTVRTVSAIMAIVLVISGLLYNDEVETAP